MTDHDWDDERLEAAFREMTAVADPPDLVPGVNARLQEPDPGDSTPRHARSRWRVAVLASAAAVVVVAGGLLLRPSSPSGAPGTTRHYSVSGISFDYPSTWAIHDRLPGTSGMGATWAILGTSSWDGCGDGDLQCFYDRPMAPATITVEIGEAIVASDEDICVRATTRPDLQGRGPTDAPATGSLTRVDGRPALRTDYAWHGIGFYEADEQRDWFIAAPGSTTMAYVVSAIYRGPGLDAFRADVDQLLASVRFSTTDGIGGSDPNADCGAPFPVPGPGGSATPLPQSSPASP